MTPSSPLKRVVVRCVFAGVLLYCLGQYAVVQVLGEPYPGIMMPGFPGSGGYHEDGTVRVRALEALFVPVTGESKSFSQEELLGELPVCMHNTIAENFLVPLPEGQTFQESPTIRTGVRFRVFPGLHAGQLDRTTPENVASMTSWLRDRARKLVPDQTVDHVEIRWFEETYRHEHGRLAKTREPVGSLVVRLGVTKP